MSNYERLTLLFNQAVRHTFPFENESKPYIKNQDKANENGIYIMFEAGESFNKFDRVVRIGSHTEPNQLIKRLNQHFTQKHRQSVFRKHLGRSFMMFENKEQLIQYWDLKPANKNYSEMEKEYEEKVTNYLKSKLSFVLISGADLLNDKIKRLRLESALIATFAQAKEKTISENWLGNYHPDKRIKKYGLWNIDDTGGNVLNSQELDNIIQIINKET